ncbi:MAG: hypothetical protein PVG14_05270 [Anaerolineales bacterium]|jgi:hypothetical protein
MEDKITIIEGPPPVFEAVNELWVHGLSDSDTQSEMVLTRLRTFNGPALIERCYHAWQDNSNINLEYRTQEGLEVETPIVAARYIKIEEGDMLLLWLRLTDEAVELEIGYDDDSSESDEDDWGLPDDPF